MLLIVYYKIKNYVGELGSLLSKSWYLFVKTFPERSNLFLVCFDCNAEENQMDEVENRTGASHIISHNLK